MSTHFEGRNAIVTGGASGIGRAIVGRLVKRGVRVAVWDVDPARLDDCARELGDAVLPQRMDISKPDMIDAAAAEAAARLGRFGFLVNCAGIIGRRMPIAELDPAEVDRVIAINVTGTLLATKAFLAHADDRPGKAIVNMSSVARRTGGAVGNAIYALTKAAVGTLTLSHAKELAPDVRVNALAPGIIDTAIQKDVYASREDMMTRLAGVPMGRPGEADEVAPAAVWLLSEEASYVTGSIYEVAGGF